MLRHAQVLREAEKAKKMSERKDYYKILSLDRSADVRDIKRVRTPSCCHIQPAHKPHRRVRVQASQARLLREYSLSE